MPIRWILSILCFTALTGTAAEPKPPQILTFELAISAKSEMAHWPIKAMTDILKKKGFEFNAIDFPSRRGLEELKSGRVDGSLGRIGAIDKILGTPDLIQIEYPIVTITASLWCSKSVTASTKNVRIANRLGVVLGNTLLNLLEPGQVKVEDISSYNNIVQMMKTGRVDCFLANDHIVESENIPLAELDQFHKHDLITSQAFPWIKKSHAHLKPFIEEGLRSYPFPAEFRRKYQLNKVACSGDFDMVCPDGIIWKKKIDLKKPRANQG